MAIPDPDQPPPAPLTVAAEDIFADPEAALAELDELNEQYLRGELTTITTEELKERLGLWTAPDAGECG